jgi:hypothetical protein
MSITYTFKGDIRTARTGDKTRIIHPFSIAKATDPQSCYDLEIATGTTDEVINFGSVVNAKLVAVFSDQPLTIKVNGIGNTAIPFKDIFAIGAGVESGQEITELHISNASGSTATIQLYIVGVVT